MHPRILELFCSLGIAEKFVDVGQKNMMIELFINGGKKGTMDFSIASDSDVTPFPFVLVIEQYKTEKILSDYLAQNNHAVQRNTLFESLENSDAYSYVIACDGAKSPIRHMLHIPFVGDTYQQEFVVADVILQDTYPHERIRFGVTDA